MKQTNISFLWRLLFLGMCFVVSMQALEVKITKDLPYVDVNINAKEVRIQRVQDTQHKLKNSYIRTSRPTPPFYIQPFRPIAGIKTVTELDVLDFIKDKMGKEGVLIDARMPKWYANGTIPGALNVPFSILMGGEENPYIAQIFALFGAHQKGKKWDFKKAQTLLIFDNGPWCQQAVAAMKELVQRGYPKKKILYYRGGMQFWQILGLTTLKPNG